MPLVPVAAELIEKLRQVEENAWMLFAELPHSAARNRALHLYLDTKALKTRLEKLETVKELRR